MRQGMGADLGAGIEPSLSRVPEPDRPREAKDDPAERAEEKGGATVTDRSDDMELALEAFDEVITRAYIKCCLGGFVAGAVVGMLASIVLTISIRG